MPQVPRPQTPMQLLRTAAALSLAGLGFAQVITFPAGQSLIYCKTSAVRWSGGVAPYTLTSTSHFGPRDYGTVNAPVYVGDSFAPVGGGYLIVKEER